MKLSIAMATYNGSHYLKEQLDSFLCQSRLPDELIVCDDCSIDGTVELIKQFTAVSLFPVHIYVNETTLGSTKNFEKAIKACTGDIIFLADQDDVWIPERLEKFEAVFQKDNDIGLVFCDSELVDENLQSLNRRNWESLNFNKKMQEKFLKGESFSILLYRNVVSGCAMAFRTEFRKYIVPMPEDLQYVIHDYWISILLSTICKIELINEPLVKYRQHSKQQVGAGKGVIGGALTPVRYTKSLKSFQARLDQIYSFVNLLDRLEMVRKRILITDDNFYRKAINKLTEHIVHLRARTKVQNKSRWRRLPVILKEIVSLRYRRYSNGLASALKDLLF